MDSGQDSVLYHTMFVLFLTLLNAGNDDNDNDNGID